MGGIKIQTPKTEQPNPVVDISSWVASKFSGGGGATSAQKVSPTSSSEGAGLTRVDTLQERSIYPFEVDLHQTTFAAESFDVSEFSDPAVELYNKGRTAYSILPKDQQGNVPVLNPSVRMGDQLFYDVEKGELVNEERTGATIPLYWRDMPDPTSDTKLSGIGRYLDIEGDSLARFDSESAEYLYSFYKNIAQPEQNVISKDFKLQDSESLVKNKFENKRGAIGQTFSYSTNLDALLNADENTDLDYLRQTYGKNITFRERKFLDKVSEASYIPEEMIGALASGTKGERRAANILGTAAKSAALFIDLVRSVFVSSFGETRGDDIYVTVAGFGGQTTEVKLSEETKNTIINTITPGEVQEEGERVLRNFLEFNKALSKVDANDPMMSDAKLVKSNLTPAQEAEIDYGRMEIASRLHNEAYFAVQTNTPEGFRLAVNKLMSAYKLESQVGARSPLKSYDWINDPEKERTFHQVLAQVELQKGEPLTRLEVLQVKEQIADPTVEFIGQAVFDLLNFIDLPLGKLLTKLPEGKVLNTLRKTIPDLDKRNVGGVIWQGAKNSTQGAMKKVFTSIADKLPADNIAKAMFTNAAKFDGTFLRSKRQLSKRLGNRVSDLVTSTFGSDSINATSAEDIMNVIGPLGNDVSKLRSEGKETWEIIEILKKSGKYPGNILTNRKMNTAVEMVELLDPLAKDGVQWSKLVSDSAESAKKYLADDRFAKAVATKGFGSGLSADEFKEVITSISKEAKDWATKNVRPSHIAQDFSRQFRKAYSDKYVRELSGLRKVVADWYSRWLSGWIKNILSRSPKFFAVFQPIENFLMYHLSGNGSVWSSLDNVFRSNPELIDNLLELKIEARQGFVGSMGFDVGDSEDVVAMLKKNKSAWLPTPKSFKFWADASTADQFTNWLKYMDDDAIEKLAKNQLKSSTGFVKIPNGKYKGRMVLVIGGKPIRMLTPSTSKNARFLWNAWSDAGRSIASANELVIKSMVANDQHISNMHRVSPLYLNKALPALADNLRKAGFSEDAIRRWTGVVGDAWNASNGSSFRFGNLIRLADASGGKVVAHTFIPDEFFSRKLGMSVQEQDAFLRTLNRETNNFLAASEASGKALSNGDVDEFINILKLQFEDEMLSITNPKGIVGQGIFGEVDDLPDAVEKVTKISEQLDYVPTKTRASVVGDVTGLNQFQEGEKILDDMYEGLFDENFDRAWWDAEANAHLDEFIKENPGQKEITEAYRSYGRKKGKQLELKEQLNLKRKSEPDNEVINRVYDQIDTIDSHIDTRESAMFSRGDNFASFYYPGSKIGNPKNKHYAYEQVQAMKGARLERKGKFLDLQIEAIENGKPIPIPTHKDDFAWYGWEWGGDTTPTSLTIENPVTGDKVTFGQTLLADGSKVDDPLLAAAKRKFGVYDMALLDEPMSMPKHEFNELQKAAEIRANEFGVNRVIRSDEEIADLNKAFFQTELDRKYIHTSKTNRELIEPIIGDVGPDDTAEDVITKLRDVSSTTDHDDTKEVFSQIADTIEERMKYHSAQFSAPGDIVGTPINITDLEEVRAWTDLKLTNASQRNASMKLLDDWGDILKGRVYNGTIYKPPVSEDELKILNREVNNISQQLAEMEDLVWYGGEYDGTAIEGAIPKMKKWMRVPDETVIGEQMKKLVTFYSFATKGAMSWFNAAIDHPQILSLYFNNMRHSRAQAYKYGAVNSRGEQIPSTIGKLYLPALDIWFDPFAVSPFFKYYFTPRRDSYMDEQTELPAWERFSYMLRGEAALRGFGINPWVDVALTAAGMKDQYSDATWGQKARYYGVNSLVPTELIPPFIWNYFNSVGRRVQFSGRPDMFNTKVKWFDYLVEDAMTKDYLTKIRQANSDEEKNNLVQELGDAIAAREKSEIWNSYFSEVEKSSYYRQMTGWFTGIYSKPFTPADAELYALRNSININKSAINNEVQRQIFFPYMDAEEVYNYYTESRYEAPEGKLYGVRNIFSWVVDDEGNPMYGEERRAQIGQAWERQVATTEYYDAMHMAWQTYHNNMKNVPIGRQYSDPRAQQYREELYNSLAEIETKPEFRGAERAWSIGYKPKELIYSHYRNLWWQMLYKSYPYREYESGESYEDWKVRENEWLTNLPTLANELSPLFTAKLMSIMPPADNISPEEIISQLVSETSREGYVSWDMDRDTVESGLMKAWDELYANAYWEIVGPLSGNIRTKAEQDFVKNNPPPSYEQLHDKMKEMYGNRWTSDEIYEAMRSTDEDYRPVQDVEGAYALGKSAFESKRDEIWDIYSWTRPGSGLFKRLTSQMLKQDATFDSDKWDTFFNSEGLAAWDSEEEFDEFYESVKKAAGMINLQPPGDQELALKVQAEQLNNQLGNILSMELGEDYKQYVDAYQSITDYAQKKQYREAHPDKYEIYENYKEMRKQYAKKYPIWEMFYMPPKGTAYYGYNETQLPIGGRVGSAFIESGGGVIQIPVQGGGE